MDIYRNKPLILILLLISTSISFAQEFETIEIDSVTNLPTKSLPFDRPFKLKIYSKEQYQVHKIIPIKIKSNADKYFNNLNAEVFDDHQVGLTGVWNLRRDNAAKSSTCYFKYEYYIIVSPLQPNRIYDFLILTDPNEQFLVEYYNFFQTLHTEILAVGALGPLPLSDASLTRIDLLEGNKDLFHPIKLQYQLGAASLNLNQFLYIFKNDDIQKAIKNGSTQLVSIDFTTGLSTITIPAANLDGSGLKGGILSLARNLDDLITFYQTHLRAAFIAGDPPNRIIQLMKENAFTHNKKLQLTLNWTGGAPAQIFTVDYPQWNLLLNGYSLSATTNVFSFETRTKYSVNLDFGLLGYRGNKDFFGISPFYGVNVEFRYFDKDVPRQYVAHGPGVLSSLASRLSFSAGVTTTSLSKDKVRSDFFSKTSLMTGFGIRITNAVRLIGGVIWYNRIDPNFLIDRKTLGIVGYGGISIDLRVRKILADLGLGPKLDDLSLANPTINR